eukprot:g11776.t1
MAHNFFAQLLRDNDLKENEIQALPRLAQSVTARASQNDTLVLPIALRTESWELAWPVTNGSFERALSTHRALVIVLMLPADLEPDTNSQFIINELNSILAWLCNAYVYNSFLTYLSRLCALLRNGCVYECQYAETVPGYTVPNLGFRRENYREALQNRVAGYVPRQPIGAGWLGQLLFRQSLLDPLTCPVPPSGLASETTRPAKPNLSARYMLRTKVGRSFFHNSTPSAGKAHRAVVAWQKTGNEQSATRALVRFDDPSELPGHNDKSDGVTVKVSYTSLNWLDALVLTGAPGVAKKFPPVPGIDFVGKVLRDPTGTLQPGKSVVLTGHYAGQWHDGASLTSAPPKRNGWHHYPRA